MHCIIRFALDVHRIFIDQNNLPARCPSYPLHSLLWNPNRREGMALTIPALLRSMRRSRMRRLLVISFSSISWFLNVQATKSYGEIFLRLLIWSCIFTMFLYCYNNRYFININKVNPAFWTLSSYIISARFTIDKIRGHAFLNRSISGPKVMHNDIVNFVNMVRARLPWLTLL